MTNEIQFLQDHVQAEEEVWKSDHVQAMKCVELEEKIRVGISLFGLINGTDDLWSRRVQSRSIKFDASVAKRLFEIYQWWVMPCADVFGAIIGFEKQGYQVKGADDLRKAHSTARNILRTNVDEVIAGFSEAA